MSDYLGKKVTKNGNTGEVVGYDCMNKRFYVVYGTMSEGDMEIMDLGELLATTN